MKISLNIERREARPNFSSQACDIFIMSMSKNIPPAPTKQAICELPASLSRADPRLPQHARQVSSIDWIILSQLWDKARNSCKGGKCWSRHSSKQKSSVNPAYRLEGDIRM